MEKTGRSIWKLLNLFYGIYAAVNVVTSAFHLQDVGAPAVMIPEYSGRQKRECC